MRHPRLMFACIALLPVPSAAQQIEGFLDSLSEKLTLTAAGDRLRARLSGTLDIDTHVFDPPAPGLVDADDSPLLQPRLSLFLDAQAGSAIYAFAQVRVDRGFDPADNALRVRLDEYAIRYSPLGDGRLNLQAGQFATLAGQWVHRHLSWQNPLITAPLFYEQRTGLSAYDRYPSVHSLTTQPDGGLPVIWGPAYATGAAVSGRWRTLEWGAEVKNASVSSHPRYWDLDGEGFDTPALTARIAWRPDLRWTLGLSASTGSYLAPPASYDAAPGAHRRSDHSQTVWLADLSYAHRRLQVWAELLHATFDVPYLGTLRTSAYFVEVRYKLTPRLSAAARWNQQFFSELASYNGETVPWGIEQGRLDAAVTWRFSAHLQAQAEVNLYTGPDSRSSPTAALRCTLRF